MSTYVHYISDNTNIAFKVSELISRINIDPEITSVLISSTYIAPNVVTTFSTPLNEIGTQILNVLYISIFDGKVSGVDYLYNNKVSSPRNLINSSIAPTNQFDIYSGYNAGSMIFDPTDSNIKICTNATPGSANWINVPGATGAAVTLTPSNSNISVGSSPNYSLAVGNSAGTTSVVLNNGATGASNNGANTIAIGYQAGQSGQSTGAISLGYQAGHSGQGTGAIAIGCGAVPSNQASGSIVIGASGATGTTFANSIQIGNQCHAAGAAGRLAFGNNMEGLYTTAGVTGTTFIPLTAAGFIIIEWNGVPYKVPMFPMV